MRKKEFTSIVMLVAFLLVLCYSTIVFVSCKKTDKSDIADTNDQKALPVFSDVDGKAVILEEDGLYSTQTKTDAPLKWTAEISAEVSVLEMQGSINVVLKEDGIASNLTNLVSSNDKYSVGFGFYKKNQLSAVNPIDSSSVKGTIVRNNDCYNAIFASLDSSVLKQFNEYDKVKITIYGSGTKYELGEISLSEIDKILNLSLFGSNPEGSCGGYIFYDKGYYSDGWRYLEAAPTQLRVVDGIPKVGGNTMWGDDIVFGYSDDRSQWKENGTGIGTGKRNTEELVEYFGDETFTSKDMDAVTWYYAAKLCYDLVYVAKDGKEYDDWFLPSKDELDLMYSELYKKRGLAGGTTWSSSVCYNTYVNGYSAVYQVFSNKGLGAGYQQFSRSFITDRYRVWPVRAF